MSSRVTEGLLAESAWLRNLTRQLVGDPELAADLQQDVAIAALSQPVAAAAGRSWLAAVARNLAISLRRRLSADDRRVRRLPPREPPPQPDDLVAAAELQQRAVAAVLALPGIYRDTVLLRFMRGQSVHATAIAMNVPEETVRTRQKRAVAMLRAKLGPQIDPGQAPSRGLAAFLLTFATWSAAVKTKHLFVVAVLALIALIGSTPFLLPGEDLPPGGTRAAVVVVNTDHESSVDAQLELAAAQATRSEVRPSTVDGPDLPATAVLTVQVKWEAGGLPATGIAVLVRRSGTAGEFLSTDAEGQVRLADLSPDEYRVYLPDYSNQSVDLVPGSDETLSFELDRWTEVSGLVVDQAGNPVPDAELLLAHGGVVPQWTFPMGRCDHTGRFRIMAKVGLTLLGARHERFGASDVQLLSRQRFAGKPPEIVLRLSDQVCTVRGRAIDAAGDAVAGAWVQLGRPGGRFLPDDQGRLWQRPPPAKRTTDADGRFEIRTARVANNRLSIYRRGFAPHRQQLELIPHGVCELAVTLGVGTVLRGKVTGEDGAAIAGVEVSIGGLRWPQRNDAETDANGAYEFVDLPRGEFRCTVRARGLAKQERQLTFAAGELQRWDVTLLRGARIRGRLVDADGRPLVKWWIGLPSANRRAKTGPDGRFVVAGCSSVGNTLIVRDSYGFVPEIMRFENIPPGENERTFAVPDHRRPSARIRGRCIDQDQQPLRDVTIDLVQRGRSVLIDNKIALTGRDGEFEVGPFPPGRYVITPSHKDSRFEPQEVVLEAGRVHDFGILRASAK